MNYNFEHDIKKYFKKINDVLDKLDVEIISGIANLLIKTLNNEGTIYITKEQEMYLDIDPTSRV